MPEWSTSRSTTAPKGVACNDHQDPYSCRPGLADNRVAIVGGAEAKSDGHALGNVLVGDYGSQGKVTAAFDPDGTVAMTFPDGTKRRQAWVADANYFCMIATPGADGKMGYRCERNLIAGKKLGETWQQVDSEGLTATISVQPRSK